MDRNTKEISSAANARGGVLRHANPGLPLAHGGVRDSALRDISRVELFQLHTTGFGGRFWRVRMFP